MDGDFRSIFLEGNNDRDSSVAASNMVSNVSIAYNAGDSSQRNAVLVAQQKIAKAQKRKDEQDKKKEAKGIKTEYTTLDNFSSIFYESNNDSYEVSFNSLDQDIKNKIIDFYDENVKK